MGIGLYPCVFLLLTTISIAEGQGIDTLYMCMNIIPERRNYSCFSIITMAQYNYA